MPVVPGEVLASKIVLRHMSTVKVLCPSNIIVYDKTIQNKVLAEHAF